MEFNIEKQLVKLGVQLPDATTKVTVKGSVEINSDGEVTNFTGYFQRAGSQFGNFNFNVDETGFTQFSLNTPSAQHADAFAALNAALAVVMSKAIAYKVTTATK